MEAGTLNMTVVQLIVRQLQVEGVETVFGIPGGPVMPMIEALFAAGTPRFVLARSEQAAAFMADGNARASGKLGVCITTAGPGATNALTGVACSSRDSVPILLLTGETATSAWGQGAAQEGSPLGLDVARIYQPVTKASVILPGPENAATTIRHLLRVSQSGRPGPVHLSLPANMLKQRAEVEEIWSSRQYRPPAAPVDHDAAEEAAKLLHRARRPVLLAGRGVLQTGAASELRRVAEQLGLPVATTPQAKGVLPENHPLSLGVLGFAGSPQADAAIVGPWSDLLLVVGSSLGELASHAWDARLAENKRLIQVDIDPAEIGKNYPVTVGVVGDAGAFFRYLLSDGGPALDPATRTERLAAVQSLRAAHPRYLSPASLGDRSTPLKPQRVIAELRRALPDESILFSDIGNSMAWALHYFEVRQPGGWIFNGGLASMGHALPAAIGGALAAPDRPVAVLTGDAACAMTGIELHTAVELGLPVVVVVMNDGGHGMVRLGERIHFGDRFTCSRFKRRLDLAALAEAVGAAAYRAERPGEVEAAVTRALAARQPALVDVRIDPDEAPPTGLRLQTLERFFNAEGQS